MLGILNKLILFYVYICKIVLLKKKNLARKTDKNATGKIPNRGKIREKERTNGITQHDQLLKLTLQVNGLE